MNFKKCVSIGPFRFKITTDIPLAASNFSNLYADYDELDESQVFIDYFASVKRAKGVRGWVKPQVDFYFDDYKPFNPLPLDQAYAMLEWGMNWCIANHAHQFFILHAAAIERKGQVIILPAPPGSGKSTLCAAMAFSGWRLFSDELTLISPATLEITPCTRPINLKNNSIDILQRRVSGSVFSTRSEDTTKGTVALMKPPKESVSMMQQTAKPKAVIFPKYAPGAPATLTALNSLAAMQSLIDNCFNYHILGQTGFQTACNLLDKIRCYSLEYSVFEEADNLLSRLLD